MAAAKFTQKSTIRYVLSAICAGLESIDLSHQSWLAADRLPQPGTVEHHLDRLGAVALVLVEEEGGGVGLGEVAVGWLLVSSMDGWDVRRDA